MAEAALKTEIREPAVVRRFEVADLSQHGPWLMKRFAMKFPDLTEQQIGGYLRGLTTANASMFLYQDHAVALAEVIYSSGIKRAMIVQERFVWVEDRTDKDQLDDAADFYGQMQTWAKSMGAERIIVCEDSDVPKTLIEARLGRLFDTKISYARV
jgi:hypothetical protein